jgi:hypothetical protein
VVLNYFSELSHSTTVNSVIYYSAQSFCYSELSNFVIVFSHFATVSSILLQPQSFYEFVGHSQDHISYFTIVLIYFVKFLNHS